MPFIPIPDTAEVRLYFTSTAFHGGHPQIKALVRDETLPPTTFAYLEALADAYRTEFWQGEMKTHASDNLRLDKIVARDMTQEDGVVAEIIVDDTGTPTGPVLPANVAALAQWKAAEAGPPRRGFTYFPGLLESHVDFNSLSSAGAIAWQGVAQVFMDTASFLNPGSGEFVIASLYSGFTLLPPAADGTRRKVPTPRAQGLTNTVQTPTVRSAVSHQDRRIRVL